jgi:RHS repeat-associated protein
VTYTYNLSGLRASKTNTGVSVTVNYIWSGANMVYEYVTGFPATGIRHYYGLTLIYSSNGNFYLYNAHGDVVQLVDEDGEILRTYEYDAFGNEKDPDGADTNYFRYCGQYFDIESGTYYLRARYYNPANGRFTQQDGWVFGDINDPLSLNLYTYCFNNPVMFVDFSGNSPAAVLLVIAKAGEIAFYALLAMYTFDKNFRNMVNDAILDGIEATGEFISGVVDSVKNSKEEKEEKKGKKTNPEIANCEMSPNKNKLRGRPCGRVIVKKPPRQKLLGSRIDKNQTAKSLRTERQSSGLAILPEMRTPIS